MTFSESLLHFRKDRGLSQEALAEKIGVSRQAVSKWETGEAFPDLQKAILLSDALGVSLDDLCGKESLPTAADPPSLSKRRALPFVCSLVCLCAGLLLGMLLFDRTPVNTEIPAMPDTVTASGVAFYSGRTEDALTYQFVPSVTGSAYTYRISFTNSTGEILGFDAACTDGMCAGTVQLSPYGEYTVAVTVSNSVEERAVPLAKGLLLYGNRVSWDPWTP